MSNAMFITIQQCKNQVYTKGEFFIMAQRIKVISLYRPRIELGNTVQKPELIRLVSRATGLVEATMDYGIKELRDQEKGELLQVLTAAQNKRLEEIAPAKSAGDKSKDDERMLEKYPD